jgi:hypothetical protein
MNKRVLIVSLMLLGCGIVGVAQNGLQLTEILYDIPSSPNGDPNGDGTRQPAGDEFFELFNNSASTIDLSGYVMIEREGQVVFTFPVGTTLGAGKFVVVFGNAVTTSWGNNLPAGTLKFSHYEGATDRGFGPVTTKTGSSKTNFASNGDRVMIVDPLMADTLAEVSWGYDNQVPAQKVLPLSQKGIYLAGTNSLKGDTIQGTIRQSITVQRATGKWGRHKDVQFAAAGDSSLYFSPGQHAETATSTSVDEQSGELNPASFQLTQNYPNPFNPSTLIRFSLTKEENVSLNVYDCLGHKVATLLQKKLGAGTFFVAFDGSGLSAGVYFYTLQAGFNKDTKRMVLLK